MMHNSRGEDDERTHEKKLITHIHSSKRILAYTITEFLDIFLVFCSRHSLLLRWLFEAMKKVNRKKYNMKKILYITSNHASPKKRLPHSALHQIKIRISYNDRLPTREQAAT